MEDGVPEAESLLRPTSFSEDEVAIEGRRNPQVAKPEGEEIASGFINHLISNLVTGGDTDEEEIRQDKARDEEETVPDPEGVKKEEKGGGVLDHIISNLFNPLSPRAGENSHGKFEDTSEGEVGESKKENQEMVKVDGDPNANKTEEGGGGGGGIMDNIVSHLPTSLPDDAAPTTDEATILIHIVQD